MGTGSAETAGAAGGVGITHVLMAVDESGSMAGLADDVRGGFNTYLDGLTEDGGGDRFRLTVVMFNDQWLPLCPVGSRPADVPRLDNRTYRPGGNTALNDAVGNLILDFERGTVLGEGDRVLLVVQTDGKENSSREFTDDAVKALIDERTSGGRWAAIYLGAGPAAWNGGGRLGMRTVNTTADSAGTVATYSGIATASAAYAMGADTATTHAVVVAAAGIPDDDARS